MAYVSNFLTQSSTTGGATVSLTLPPHVANDIIVICVSADGGGTLSATWGGSSTNLGQVGTTQVSGALLSGAVFHARATGSAATCTINMGTADAIHVHMVILKDVSTTTALDASNATVGAAALEFTTASITTTTADCLILYYVAGDDATTTPHATHSRPGPTATMHFLDSSDNGGTTVTTLASGALGWYQQRAAGATPTPTWDQSSSEVFASFVMAFRNASGGVIPAYVDDSASLGQQLMTGTWFVAATTRNNQNFTTTLTYGFAAATLVTTSASGNGTDATIEFATQARVPFQVGQTITVTGVTPTGYNVTATVKSATTSSVTYANTTTGAQTVAGRVGGIPTTFDAAAVVVDAGLNPYSSAINSTPGITSTNASGFQLIFPTTEYDMTTGWIVGAFMASTSKMALFNQGSIAQGGTYLLAGKAFNALTTTAASGTGSTATITFTPAQSIAIPVGTMVVVAGVTPTGYNGTFIVTGSTTTTVSYANTTTGAQTVAGTVTANIYRSFNLMARDNQDGEGAGFAVFSAQVNQTQTSLGYSGADIITPTKIDRIAVLHMGQNAAGAFRYMDFHLIKLLIVAGGTSASPVDTQGFFDTGRFCRIPLLKKSGASGLVAYVPVQIGGGDAVNFQINAGALQFPRIASTTKKEINYHGADNAIGISYAGKSGDVIKHTNSVVTSPSPYYWEINAAATSAATWDFTGLVIVGANVTLRNVMTFSKMAFSGCPTLNFSGVTVSGCDISSVPAGNDTLTTTGTTSITGSTTINVSGVTAGNRWCSVGNPGIFDTVTFTGGGGHAVRLTTPGSYTLTDLTWNSFGADETTGAAIFNDSGGAVTLTRSGGNVPTVRNGSGASTTILNAAVTTTITVKDIDTGSPISSARVLVTASDNTGPMPFDKSTSITRSGSTATATVTGHGLIDGKKALIKGSDQQEYNGVFVVTVTGTNTFTYTVSGSPATPATGTIKTTGVVIDGLTDGSGVISDSRSHASNQPVTGRVRKATGGTTYKTGSITGTISSSSGFSVTVQMIKDE